MKLTRRRILAGAGALGVSSAGVIGTTAFTQVEAERDFDIGVSGDEDAQLALIPGDETSVTSYREIEGGSDVLEIELENINTQGDTVFEDAFTIENQAEIEDSLFVFIPRALDADDVGITNARQESVEFLVDTTSDAVLTTQGTESGPIDISLPPAYPDAFSENPETPDATSAAGLGKVTNTGAIELAHDESVSVDINVLDFPAESGEEISILYQFSASRTTMPSELDDWEVDDE